MIGHPGKSAETSLPANGYEYGKWVGEVIDALKYDQISLFGGSFGAGVIAKAMCVCPDKVKRVVLYVPSGIKNAPTIKSVSMILPMTAYWITGKDKWLKKCMLPMAITEDNITKDIYETAKLSIDNIKVKTVMPGNVDEELMKKCYAPTLVMAAFISAISAGIQLSHNKSACPDILLSLLPGVVMIAAAFLSNPSLFSYSLP